MAARVAKNSHMPRPQRASLHACIGSGLFRCSGGHPVAARADRGFWAVFMSRFDHRDEKSLTVAPRVSCLNLLIARELQLLSVYVGLTRVWLSVKPWRSARSELYDHQGG